MSLIGTEDMHKLKLEPTAALVMLWALKLYRNEQVLRFVNQFDLSSGKALFEKCDSVCNWYSEIIMNRKNFIKHLIENELSTAKQGIQLIILAAGKSPLAIEVLLENSSKVYRVFEVDLSGMNEKRNIYAKLFPQFKDKLRCVTADIASPDIQGLLNMPENGYRHDIKTIIVLEGISYYLHKHELTNIIANFRPGGENIFIIEYLVPYRCVDRARRSIPREIFRIIQEYSHLSAITSYTKEELKTLFLKNGGDMIASYCIADMEVIRTGANNYFKKPGDGWIECAVGRIGAL